MSITNVDHVCINCMREKPSTAVCPYCGFDEAQYEPSPHHLPPRSILSGKCLIGRVLGEGGFGITYLGWDLNLDLKLAIKEYYPTGYVTRTNTSTSTVTPYRGEKTEFFTTGRSRFINEAKTLAKYYTLPGIVSVRDFFLENGTAYIVMEFVEGETLKQRLARVGGKMEASEIFELVRPLLRSLSEMHASGLIHRDISPDNIMITPENNIKLIDFGAARDYLDSGNRSLSVMLKPGFAPEEQYFARGQQGPWTDIYALCATIYRAITGTTPQESVERLRHDELQPPSALGARLTPAQETALIKGLSVTQEGRWQTVPELYAALYPSDGSVVSIKQPGKKEQEKKRKPIQFPKINIRLNKQWLIGIAAAVGILLIVLAVNLISSAKVNKTMQQLTDTLSTGDYASATELLNRIDTSDPSNNEALYQTAEKLLAQGEYEQAQFILDEISGATSLDLTSLSDEILYQKAKDVLADGDFEGAQALFSKITNQDQYDVEATLAEALKLDIDKSLQSGAVSDAVSKLTTLKESNGEQAEALIGEYASTLYDFGVAQYRAGEFISSREAFALLPSDYQRAEDYLLLASISRALDSKPVVFKMEWDWNDENDPERLQTEQLRDLIGFENASTLLLGNTQMAELFLLGTWSDGTNSFTIRRNTSGIFGNAFDKDITQIWNMPGILSVDGSFSNGTLFQREGTTIRTKLPKAAAHISIVDINTIEVKVTSSGITYTLRRQ